MIVDAELLFNYLRDPAERLRRWLCAKHKVSSGGYGRYPDRHLTEILGLVRLPLLRRRYRGANA